MQKRIKFYILLIFTINISYCCQVWNPFYDIFPKPEIYLYDISHLINTESITDLPSAWQWVDDNIKYKSDNTTGLQFDDWQSAEETLVKRTGDCEDFSILLGELLNRLGYDTYVVIIITEELSLHALLKVESNYIEPQRYGKYYIQENLCVIAEYNHSTYTEISINNITRSN